MAKIYEKPRLSTLSFELGAFGNYGNGGDSGCDGGHHDGGWRWGWRWGWGWW
jgi:hypothetical protein